MLQCVYWQYGQHKQHRRKSCKDIAHKQEGMDGLALAMVLRQLLNDALVMLHKVCRFFGYMSHAVSSAFRYVSRAVDGSFSYTLLFDSVYMWLVVLPISFLAAYLTDMSIYWLFVLCQGTEIIKVVFEFT